MQILSNTHVNTYFDQGSHFQNIHNSCCMLFTQISMLPSITNEHNCRSFTKYTILPCQLINSVIIKGIAVDVSTRDHMYEFTLEIFIPDLVQLWTLLLIKGGTI